MLLYKFFENPKIYNLITTIFSFNNKRLKKYLPKLLNVKNNDYLLDVGCGTGKYAIFSCKYVGIDPNEDYINYAKKNYAGTFLKMDGVNLKFPDHTFDFVINISALHHVADNIVEKMIFEMKRVCKKNGLIFIVDAVYPKKINFLGYLLFKFDRGRHRRTFEELRGLLSKNSFKLIADNIGKTFPYRWSVFSHRK